MLKLSHVDFAALTGILQDPIPMPTFITPSTSILGLAMQTFTATIVPSCPLRDVQLWGPLTGYHSLILTGQCPSQAAFAHLNHPYS